MSRLFSRLENMGQDQNDGALPDPPPGADRQENAHGDAPAPAPAETWRDTHAAAVSAELPTMRPLVPGYAISSSLSSSLGMAAPPVQVVARPVWPVRLWLLSLLLVPGLSLLVLAMPERLLPLATQARTSATAVPDAPILAPAAPKPAAVARPDRAPAPSAAASAIVTPTPTPLPATSAPRAEPRSRITAAVPAPAIIPATPLHPAADPACSEAMLAMNLCSKSSP